jgi:glutathione S-transferase
MTSPIIVRLATGAHRATDDAGREDLMLLPERLDQIDAWIAEGLLDGDELNAADFQIGANVRALLFSEDLAPFVEGRPAEHLARRVAPDYPGHMGRGALPAEWLQPLRDAATPEPAGPDLAVLASTTPGSWRETWPQPA